MALLGGLSQFMFAIYRNGIAALILAPFAYFLEKVFASSVCYVCVCVFPLLSYQFQESWHKELVQVNWYNVNCGQCDALPFF